jgi:hypothetical protein
MSDKRALPDGFYWVRLPHYSRWTVAENVGGSWIAIGINQTLRRSDFAEVGDVITRKDAE